MRALVRRAVLATDWQAAGRIPSRLRGTYRVDIDLGGERTARIVGATLIAAGLAVALRPELAGVLRAH